MDLKKVCKKLLFPPTWLLFFFTIITTVSLTTVFAKGLDASPIAYVVYVFSFYTLTVVCIFCSQVLPRQIERLKQKVYNTKYGNQYMTNAMFRSHISLHISLAFKIIYVCTNIISFFLYHSMWFIILAGYYATLGIMLFLLLRYRYKHEIGENLIGEWKRAKLCSYILLSVNFALSGAVLMILYQNKRFEYNGILIYVMAAYTFYITIQSAINLVKYRKYNSPVMTVTKIISLSAALVSMLALETAMFSQFGTDMSLGDQRLMIALTGAGVSIVVVTLSLSMIIKSTKETKKLRSIHYE